MEQVIGYIGRKTIDACTHLLELAALLHRMLAQIVDRPRAGSALIRRIVIEQIYFTAVQALPILMPVALLVGSMVIVQFARLSGQYDFGRLSVLLIIREVGPIITALLVILRSATAVTIEISYMRVLHELDALEMAGLDPIRVVCLPRLIGITSAMLGLFIVFDLVSIMGGYLIVWAMTDVPMGNFLYQIGKAVKPADIGVGLLKAVVFGVVITVTSLYRGFETKLQITEVPVATSRSAVECFLYCLVMNLLISITFYL